MLTVMLWEQLRSVTTLILVVAAALAAALGKAVDASAILAIVLLFVALGIVQEYRAQRAIARLRQMASSVVQVVRGGRLRGLRPRTRPRRPGASRS